MNGETEKLFVCLWRYSQAQLCVARRRGGGRAVEKQKRTRKEARVPGRCHPPIGSYSRCVWGHMVSSSRCTGRRPGARCRPQATINHVCVCVYKPDAMERRRSEQGVGGGETEATMAASHCLPQQKCWPRVVLLFVQTFLRRSTKSLCHQFSIS